MKKIAPDNNKFNLILASFIPPIFVAHISRTDAARSKQLKASLNTALTSLHPIRSEEIILSSETVHNLAMERKAMIG